MNKITAILIAITLSLPSVTKSQNDKEEIKKVITSLSADVQKLISEGGSKADNVMAYTASNFTYTSKTINIMNTVSSDSYNRDVLSYALHQMRSSGVTSKRTLGSLDEIYIRDRAALAIYEVDYELFESDRTINRGHQFNQMILRKNPQGAWKIESLNTLSVDDLTYKSICICEIYETKGLDNIITETIVPDGHEADVMEDKFSIDEKSEPRLVRHGFRDYYWMTSGAIFKRNIDGTNGDQVGNAKSRQELLLTLIQKEVYPDRCNTVIRKLK